ncbi:MAG TPA: ferredoxin--NADP reductase [Gemmataceae bacterium]
MSPEEIAALREKRYNATVASLRLVNPDLMILRVEPDFPVPPHLPGQYTTLGLGNWEPRFPGCQEEVLGPGSESRLVRRAYSISCSILSEADRLLEAANSRDLEFYITLVRENPDGRPPALTPRLFMLKEGDRLHAGEKITGHYTLEGVGPEDTVLFLSTGTGEAPNNYMVWELLRRGHRGRILSACCVRYRRDLGYLAVHRKLTEMFPNYTYIPLTTREAEAAERKMYLQDLIDRGILEQRLGHALDPASTHVFLCGNPKMIGIPQTDPQTGARLYPQPTGVIEVLERRGFRADDEKARAKGNIHFEKYW